MSARLTALLSRRHPGEFVLNDVWNLHSVDWMRELPDQEVEDLRRSSSRSEHCRGATVFTPDTHPDSVFLLETGLVRIYRLSADGDETTFGYVAPGQVFGELSAFGDFARESFAMAVQPSGVARIPVARFQRLLEKHPAAALAITRQIGRRMKRIESRVETLVFRDVRSRLGSILLELAEDFGEPREDAIVLGIELTQSELATLVGSARQSVNASLGELEAAGLIGREGRRLAIKKPDELLRATRAENASR